MLIAKTGAQGLPFVVGSELEFEAQENGFLFFRINDFVNANYDNEGFLDVTIETVTMMPVLAKTQPQNHQSDTEKPTVIVSNVLSKRTALVIGNSNYNFSPLENPVNDARAISESLQELGFNVTTLFDANQQQMEQAVDQFGRQLFSGKQVALFYYAGHGVQVNGENYLIPVDAVLQRQADVRYKAVNIGQVLGTMGEAPGNLNIVILDACCDNPLPRSFRSSARGLAKVEGPKGTIIGFATSPGSVASDGEGDNGVYTKHLLLNMQKPGLSIEQVFKKVLQGVNQETGGQQTPWTESSFTGDFAFVP